MTFVTGMDVTDSNCFIVLYEVRCSLCYCLTVLFSAHYSDQEGANEMKTASITEYTITSKVKMYD